MRQSHKIISAKPLSKDTAQIRPDHGAWLTPQGGFQLNPSVS